MKLIKCWIKDSNRILRRFMIQLLMVLKMLIDKNQIFRYFYSQPLFLNGSEVLLQNIWNLIMRKLIWFQVQRVEHPVLLFILKLSSKLKTKKFQPLEILLVFMEVLNVRQSSLLIRKLKLMIFILMEILRLTQMSFMETSLRNKEKLFSNLLEKERFSVWLLQMLLPEVLIFLKLILLFNFHLQMILIHIFIDLEELVELVKMELVLH